MASVLPNFSVFSVFQFQFCTEKKMNEKMSRVAVTKTLNHTVYLPIFFHAAILSECAAKTVIVASPCLFETFDLSTFSNALSAIS